jgi:hypothetical protein
LNVRLDERVFSIKGSNRSLDGGGLHADDNTHPLFFLSLLDNFLVAAK